jgi:hypothetical protein
VSAPEDQHGSLIFGPVSRATTKPEPCAVHSDTDRRGTHGNCTILSHCDGASASGPRLVARRTRRASPGGGGGNARSVRLRASPMRPTSSRRISRRRSRTGFCRCPSAPSG